MSKQRFFSILFMVLSFSAFSQMSLDSLKNVWNDASLPDTTRLNTLTLITYQGGIQSYLDSLAYYADIEIREASAMGSKKHLADGLYAKGYSELMQSQIPQGMELLDSAAALYQSIGENFGLALTNSLKGIIFILTGQSDKGFNLVEQAYLKMDEEGNLRGRQECASALFQAYSFMGNTPQEIHYSRLSLKLAEELGVWVNMASAYHSMADVFLQLGITDEGDYYHELALDYSRKSGHIEQEMNILSHLSRIENEQKNYQKSLELLDQVYQWQKDFGSPMNLKLTEAKRIYVLVSADMYSEAVEKIEAFRVGFDKGMLLGGSIKALVDYSEGIMLGNNGKHQRSVDLCLEAYSGFLGLNKFMLELEACDCLYKAYKALGQHQKALEYHEKRLLILEKLDKEKVVKDVQRFEYHKQVLADSLAQAETDRLVLEGHQEEMRAEEKTRNISIGVGGLVLLLAGGLYSRLRYVRKSKAIIEEEKDRSNNLLLNILPADIAEELKIHGKAEARDFDLVSILFTDFKGFTAASEKLSAQELVAEINTCFEAFDGIMTKYGIEKIKTIGDAYMAAGGLPLPTDDSVKNAVLAALEMQAFIGKRKAEMDAAGKPAFEMRVGIHTGPVVAGIVGLKKFQYDIWGDTVNTAARMESAGEVARVNISQVTYELLKDDADFAFESRGKIEAKGKGEIEMYFVSVKS
jgi:adenylate cyclase